MTPSALKLRAENNLAALSNVGQSAVRMIVNTSVQDAKNTLRHMTPGPLSQRILEVAIDLEKSGQARTSILEPIRAALKRCSVAEAVTVEVLPDSSLLSSVSKSSVSLVEAINANHARAQGDAAQAKALGESAVQHAILAGLQLVQLKGQTPHGQWEAMFSSGQKRVGKSNGTHVCHLLEFDRQTASRYIAVATQLVARKLQPEQSAALMALACGAPMNDDAAALLDEITPSKSLRQTYLELGIVKPTPKEAAWLAAAPAEPSGDKEKSPILKAATKLRTAKESARRDWFGTEKAGRMEPGSIVGMIATELKDPARGTLRLLSKPDLETIVEDFRSLAKYAAELAKEK